MICRILSLISLSIFLLLSFPVFASIICPNASNTNIKGKKEFKSWVKNSVFQVVIESDTQPKKEEAIGTATLVSNEGHLLTAAHIFESDNNRILKGIESKQLKLFLRIPVGENEFIKYSGARIFKISDEHDLSVIKLSDWDNNRRFMPVWLDVKSNPYDDNAQLMGYMIDKRHPSVSNKGNVIRADEVNGYLRITNLEAYQGFSGGLLINSLGMGVAVLSGKYNNTVDDNITWAQINDKENGALNAVPLKLLIDQMSKIEMDKTNSIIKKLKSRNAKLKDYVLSDLVKFDRFAAIILISKLLKTDEIFELPNWENQWNMFNLADCLMPSGITKNLFFKLRQASISDEQRKWFGNEVAKYALREVNESIEIENSISMIELAIAASSDERLTNERITTIIRRSKDIRPRLSDVANRQRSKAMAQLKKARKININGDSAKAYEHLKDAEKAFEKLKHHL